MLLLLDNSYSRAPLWSRTYIFSIAPCPWDQDVCISACSRGPWERDVYILTCSWCSHLYMHRRTWKVWCIHSKLPAAGCIILRVPKLLGRRMSAIAFFIQFLAWINNCPPIWSQQFTTVDKTLFKGQFEKTVPITLWKSSPLQQQNNTNETKNAQRSTGEQGPSVTSWKRYPMQIGNCSEANLEQ